MKTIILITILSFTSLALSNPDTNPCDVKKAEILKEIELAKSHKNKQKVAGLEKALSEVNANCTVESQAKEHQEKLNKLQRKVDERMEDLKKAEASGKNKKIEKAKKKLQEAEAELQSAK